MHLTLFQKALILVAVPLTFELCLLGTVGVLLYQAEKESRQADHSKAVIAKTTEVVQLLFDVGYAFVAYDAKTNELLGDRLNQELDETPKQLNALEDLVRTEPQHLAIVQNVAIETEENFRLVKARKKVIEDGGHLDLMEAFNMRQSLNEMVAKLDSMIKDERAQQGDPEAANRLNSIIKISLLGGVLTSILLAALLVMKFHQSTTRRLKVLMNNSVRIGAGAKLIEALEGDDEIGQIDRVLHNTADALAESQRKERAVIDNAVDVICTINADGKFATVSPASIKLWGYAPEYLIGRNWHELILKDDLDRSLNWEKLMRLAPETALENQLIRKNGTLVDMRWSGHWSEADRALFCVAHDMSERLEVERFKQQFVSMISHDLRTPLSAVKSTLELLGAGALGTLTDKAQLKVTRAEDNLRHTMDLINNLLDLEKMESGRMELELKPTSLQLVLDRCTEAVSALADGKAIAVKSPETQATVMADERRLSQLVINLLGNAIKFSPEKSEIKISVEETSLMVRISVTDHGPGIPSEQKDLVFDRYHQTGTPETARVEGTGLGLAICKAIAEAHLGTIGVESIEGEGSTFWFCVPNCR
ncbi:hypothetical protein BH10CYA1_BH10CYA1_41230 [soil metagenome]